MIDRKPRGLTMREPVIRLAQHDHPEVGSSAGSESIERGHGRPLLSGAGRDLETGSEQEEEDDGAHSP